MRLYPLRGPTNTVQSGDATYAPAEDGGFDFPPDLEAHLHAVAVDGQKQWETAIERQARAAAEELARLRDPATMTAAVAELVAAAKAAGVQAAASVTPAPEPAAKAAPAAKTATASK